MNEQQTTTSVYTTRSRVIFLVIACYLIGSFLNRAFTPAHEYPMRPEQVIAITFDVLAVVGLIGLQVHFPKPLFWISLVAGLGLFAIRLNGDASWWTGHLVYTLQP